MAKRVLNKLSTNELQAELNRRDKEAEKLARRREKLLDEVAEIDRTLADFGYEVSGGSVNGRRRSGGTRRGGGKRPKNDMNLVEALSKVLKNKTMGVSEAADAVQAAGYKTSSDNFRTIVNQTLIKNKGTFKKVARGQYTAK